MWNEEGDRYSVIKVPALKGVFFAFIQTMGFFKGK